MSNILVFGGSGFIGSHLVRRLTQAGHRVAVYDNFHPAAGSSPLLAEVQAQRIEAVRAMAPIVEGDIRDAERVRAAVAETRPELAVFLPSLLASESRNNPDTAVDIHVTGLIHCLRALADQPVRRFVYTSSSFAYGDFLTDPVKEDHPRVPIDVYGRTKLIGEELTVIACQQAKREHVIMRPAAVYGYGDSRGRLIDFMIRRALANEPILLWDPEGRADYTFVDDAADGFFRALFADGAANQAFNLTRGRARTSRSGPRTRARCR